MQGLEYLEPPKFPGLWAEDLEKPERPEGRRDVVDGRTVMRFTLLKKLVSGLAPGTVTIPPESKIRTSVRVAADPFGDPFGFFSRPQVVDLVAEAGHAQDPPDPRRRPRFKGPVGRFDLTREARPDAASPWARPSRCKVRLSGTGNLRTATEAPKLDVAGRHGSTRRRAKPSPRTRPHAGRDRVELRRSCRRRAATIDDPARLARGLRPGGEAHRDEDDARRSRSSRKAPASGGRRRRPQPSPAPAETTLPAAPPAGPAGAPRGRGAGAGPRPSTSRTAP